MKKITIAGVTILGVCLVVFIVYYTIKGHSTDFSQTKTTRTISVAKIYDVATPITEDDFVFEGFRPGQQMTGENNAIRASLGEPIKLDEHHEKDPGILERFYYYPDYWISTYLIEDREDVGDILITGSGHRTTRGISIGDPAEKVLSEYGKADESDFDGSRFYHYYLQANDDLDGSYVLEFKLDDNKVQQIKIYYYSD